MSDKPKVFKSILYSNGADIALTVNTWTGEALIVDGDDALDIVGTKTCLTEYRDIFQAALDDMEKDNG